jgi:hypothetical protein
MTYLATLGSRGCVTIDFSERRGEKPALAVG